MVGKLAELLRPFVRRHGLGRVYPGPIDILFSEGEYLVPDLVFVHRDKLGTITDRGVESAPDLVVEIISPSTALRDRGVKRERYAQLGVLEYWIVDSRLRLVEIHRAGGEPAPHMVSSGSFAWQPVPGGPELLIDVDDLFDELD
jgi:Uma2 family endonuclease